MGSRAALLLVFVLSAYCVFAPLPANAEPRTIVVPDDFQTITAAVGSAANGDTIYVKKGTCTQDTIVIGKAVTPHKIGNV